MARRHTVEPGECLSSIARRYGFSDPKTLYDHPDNNSLKDKRKNPNLLAEGDEVFIPDVETKEISFQTDEPVRIKVKVPKVNLVIVVKDEDEKPVANKPYKFSKGLTNAGNTGSDGKIEVPIKPDVEECTLEVWIKDAPEPPRKFRLKIGDMDPYDTVSGVQKRLRNLGLYRGKIDGKAESVKSALMVFQKMQKIDENGDASHEATQKKLAEVHDGST